MRTMLHWTVPVEKGNKAVKDGSITKTIESLTEELEPEAAYFLVEDGERAGMLFFDITDSAQLPLIAERLFLELDAAVEFVPVLNSDDLRRAFERLER